MEREKYAMVPMSTMEEEIQSEIVDLFATETLLCLSLERMILEAMHVVTQNASATVQPEQRFKKIVPQKEIISIDFTDT